jgi:hypothetical protein
MIPSHREATMKTAQLVIVLTMFAIALGCGYSKKSTTPPVAGAMPTIAQLSPDSVNHGGTGFNMIVNGTNFSSKAVINWNGTAQTSNTTFVSSNQLTLAVPASLITNAGTVQVTVTNPATAGTGAYGSGGTLAETSQPMAFTIN